eukprot:gene7271-11589_t
MDEDKYKKYLLITGGVAIASVVGYFLYNSFSNNKTEIEEIKELKEKIEKTNDNLNIEHQKSRKMERKLGFAENNFLEILEDNGFTIVQKAKVKGKIDKNNFKQAVSYLQQKYKILQCGVKTKENYSIFEDIPLYEKLFFEHHYVEINQNLTENDIDRLFNEEIRNGYKLFLNSPKGYKTSLLWNITLIHDNKNEFFEILLCCSHLICDGKSVCSLMSDLLNFIEKINKKEEVSFKEIPIEPAIDDFLPNIKFKKRVISSDQKYGKIIFDDISQKPNHQSVLFTQIPSKIISKLCKDHGVSVNSFLYAVFLTCYIETYCECKGEEWMDIFIPVCLRKKLKQNSKSIGLMVATMDFPIQWKKSYEKDPGLVWDLAFEINESVQQEISSENYLSSVSQNQSNLKFSHGRAIVPCLSNFGKIDDFFNFDQYKLESIFTSTSLECDGGPIILSHVSTYQDIFNFSFTSGNPVNSNDRLIKFTNLFVTMLRMVDESMGSVDESNLPYLTYDNLMMVQKDPNMNISLLRYLSLPSSKRNVDNFNKIKDYFVINLESKKLNVQGIETLFIKQLIMLFSGEKGKDKSMFEDFIYLYLKNYNEIKNEFRKNFTYLSIFLTCLQKDTKSKYFQFFYNYIHSETCYYIENDNHLVEENFILILELTKYSPSETYRNLLYKNLINSDLKIDSNWMNFFSLHKDDPPVYLTQNERVIILSRIEKLGEDVKKLNPETMMSFFMNSELLPAQLKKTAMTLFDYLIEVPFFLQQWPALFLPFQNELSLDQLKLLLPKILKLINQKEKEEKMSGFIILYGFDEIPKENLHLFDDYKFFDISMNLLKDKITDFEPLELVQIKSLAFRFLPNFYPKMVENEDFEFFKFIFKVAFQFIEYQPIFVDILGQIATSIPDLKKIKSFDIYDLIHFQKISLEQNFEENFLLVFSLHFYYQFLYMDYINYDSYFDSDIVPLMNMFIKDLKNLEKQETEDINSLYCICSLILGLKRDSYLWIDILFKNLFNILKNKKLQEKEYISTIFEIIIYQIIYYQELMINNLSRPGFTNLIVEYTYNKDSEIRRHANKLLKYVFYLEPKLMESSIDQLKIYKKFDEKLNNYETLYLLCLVGMYFDKSFLEKNIDKLIDHTINHFLKLCETDFDVIGGEIYICLLLISIFTDMYFDKMDRIFDRFGEKWGKLIIKEYDTINELEIHIINDAFSKLVISHPLFAQRYFFSNSNIIGIENKSQFILLQEGKYFRLLPETLSSILDINFKFR